MIADRTSASSGLTRSSLSVSVLLGAICSSGTSSPVAGSRYSVMPWWVSSRSSSQRDELAGRRQPVLGDAVVGELQEFLAADPGQPQHLDRGEAPERSFFLI